MSISEELDKLGELHQRGVLSDEEFARAKARVIGPSPTGPAGPAVAKLNSLYRSRNDRWLGGVCAGLAEMSGLVAWVWRLAFVVLAFFGGAGVVLYAVLWALLPESPEPVVGTRRGHA